MEKELPEACKICMANTDLNDSTTLSWHPMGWFEACSNDVCEGGNACLPKDRTMIILLNKLLKK